MFFTIGRPFAGLFCLLFQCTVIGWPVAAFWAVHAVGQYKTDKKIKKMEKKMEETLKEKNNENNGQ